jgi:hypothetical protein
MMLSTYLVDAGEPISSVVDIDALDAASEDS